jgi:hypothetical protein
MSDHGPTLLDQMSEVSGRVIAARRAFAEKLEALRQQQAALRDAIEAVHESWSQSNIGYHAELYFREFERPNLGQRFDPEWGGIDGIPEGWHDRTRAEIEAHIEAQAGASIAEFVTAVDVEVRAARELTEDVEIASAPIRSLSGLEREKALLDALVAVDFAPAAPITIHGGMSRDSMAIAQGGRAAPHQLAYQPARRAIRALEAADDALKDADRLARQIIAQLQSGVVAPDVGAEVTVTLVSLLRRFDEAARVLQDRQRDRPAFEINDEYDVQDLVHAILRLHFDDVRPEEWTPSSVGASSRIDFLLKREGVVIETKMSRQGLTAKKLGDELAVDAVRYRSHPEARILICFVYDPQKLIANPRGIEDDLAALSDDDLQVVAVIA